MLASIGWGEIVVVALAALLIFGPDRLPHLAKDAAEGLRRVRGVMASGRAQVHDALGPELGQFATADLRQYHPRAVLRKALAEEDDELPEPAGSVAHLVAEGARVADPGRRPRDPAPVATDGAAESPPTAGC